MLCRLLGEDQHLSYTRLWILYTTQPTHKQDGPLKSDAVTFIGLSNCFLIGLESCSTRENSYQVLYAWQKARGQEGHRYLEESTIILLNGHAAFITLPSKWLYLWQIVLPKNFVRDITFCCEQQLIPNQIIGKVNVECSVMNGTSVPPSPSLKDHLGKGIGQKEPEDGNFTWCCLWAQHNLYSQFMNSLLGYLQKIGPWGYFLLEIKEGFWGQAHSWEAIGS